MCAVTQVAGYQSLGASAPKNHAIADDHVGGAPLFHLSRSAQKNQTIFLYKCDYVEEQLSGSGWLVPNEVCQYSPVANVFFGKVLCSHRGSALPQTLFPERKTVQTLV